MKHLKLKKVYIAEPRFMCSFNLIDIYEEDRSEVEGEATDSGFNLYTQA